MGLSRNVSEINGNFSRKSQIFPTLAKGFPLEFCNGSRAQITRTTSLPDRQKLWR